MSLTVLGLADGASPNWPCTCVVVEVVVVAVVFSVVVVVLLLL